MMESFLVGSFPNASSITTCTGKLLRSKHYSANKNIYYASSYAPKLSQQKRKTKMEYTILKPWLSLNSTHYKHIGGESSHQEYDKKYVVKAGAAGPSSEYELHASTHESILDSVKKFFVSFFMLVAPYQYAGLARNLCTVFASSLTVEKLSDISPLFFKSVFTVIISQQLVGIYFVILNQLSDIEIDKINKPYLPLASGKISFTSGVIIATSSIILCFWLIWSVGSWSLIWNNLLSSVIWTIYSINVPLLRWKGNPVLAAMCYISTWAFLNPIGDFLHMQTFVFKRPAVFPRALNFFLVFMSLYSVGIAALKDIPDMEGDKAFGIYSFSTQFGQKRVFWFCVSLFEMAFGLGLLFGATSSCLRTKIVTVLGHVVLALVLWWHAKAVDLKSKASISSFYMLTWKLLYAEYFLMILS